MKFKFLFVSALMLFFLNCNNSKKEEKKEGEIEVINVDEPIDQGKKKKVTARDFSLKPETAEKELKNDGGGRKKKTSNPPRFH